MFQKLLSKIPKLSDPRPPSTILEALFISGRQGFSLKSAAASDRDRPLRRCVNLSRRQYLRNALFEVLHQLSGTHYRKLFSVVTLLQFLNLGLIHSSSLGLSLLSLLTNTLPGPSASESTTLRRYTNLFIIIIIFLTPVLNSQGMKKLRYAI